jgi:acyl-coenzyme A thioesterase PaaI-like protein
LASITRKAEETPARHFPDIATINLRIDYLRPGRGHYFVATGRVFWLGGRTPAGLIN